MENALMEFSPDDVKKQVQNIQHLKENVLIDKEHYGLIPGCGPKPALLKAGAEKLAFMFRLAPKFIVTKTELKDGHREYEITCELTHIPTGQYIGAGVGICSTMETKYRYRADKSADVMLDVVVPKNYWDRKRLGANAVELQSILAQQAGEPGRYGTKKDSTEQWVIVKRGESTGEKVENPDIADTYNTVIKMAKKRAYVDAVITCTAASDFFTQDIEESADLQEGKVVDTPSKPEEKPEAAAAPKVAASGNYSDTVEAWEKIPMIQPNGGTIDAYVFHLKECGRAYTYGKVLAEDVIANYFDKKAEGVFSLKPSPGQPHKLESVTPKTA